MAALLKWDDLICDKYTGKTLCDDHEENSHFTESQSSLRNFMDKTKPHS